MYIFLLSVYIWCIASCSSSEIDCNIVSAWILKALFFEAKFDLVLALRKEFCFNSKL
jgi:hypothetical protein